MDIIENQMAKSIYLWNSPMPGLACSQNNNMNK